MQYVSIVLVALCVGCLSAEKEGDKMVVKVESEKAGTLISGIMPCLLETPLDPEIITELRSGNRPKEVDEKNLQKFVYCAFIKTGYGKKNGHLKVDKALELFPENVDKGKIRKVMEECNKKEGKEPMETAAMFMKCLRESPIKVVL